MLQHVFRMQWTHAAELYSVFPWVYAGWVVLHPEHFPKLHIVLSIIDKECVQLPRLHCEYRWGYQLRTIQNIRQLSIIPHHTLKNMEEPPNP